MKILGQHFIIGLKGKMADDDLKHLLKEYEIGGVLFLAKNYESRSQLTNFVSELQNNTSVFPLLVTVDHEGGRVQRFKTEFTVLPSFRTLVEKKESELIYNTALTGAMELRSVGVNMNFTPVADMTDLRDGVIGDRSAGSDLKIVEETIVEHIKGQKNAKMLSCIKHFPGHGCVTVDSHKELPYSNKTIDELMKYEIKPFVRGIKEGIDSVMCAHIMFNKVDKLPSSLSPVFVNDLLRRRLKFKGAVITDDISMGAITNNFTSEEASFLALSATADLVIFSLAEPDKLVSVLEFVTKKAEIDYDFRKKIFASQKRIAALKAKIHTQNQSTRIIRFLRQLYNHVLT